MGLVWLLGVAVTVCGRRVGLRVGGCRVGSCGVSPGGCDGVSVSVFVMTDVVGSTAAWEAHGEAMRVALEQHDVLVLDAVVSAGGRRFKHTGDGMIAVFDGADAAALAASAAVAALAEAQWGETGPLEVRVSIHAGVSAERDGDHFGPPVNKVARINGVGHSGQILMSDVAHQLMTKAIGRDLGTHQLKDLSEPLGLWQLDDGDHPPLRTLKRARHNLPVMPTEFIGRRDEVAELRKMVSQHRLVTITGVGGCGKTRLALEVAAAVADQFPGGVWFADLTTERDGAQVAGRTVAALGLSPSMGEGAPGPVALLSEATAGSPTLLVVDNCEHLIEDVADLAAEILVEAADVTMLATSRESLSIDGEWVWRVPNMNDAAVELFVSRASATGVGGLEDHLGQVEEICRQLDDIPLAIELAAPRLSTLSLDELANRLDDRFALLGGGRVNRRQRQQTLQAMMDWSYGLLDEEEQRLLNELAVFAGTFPLAGVEAVANPGDTPIVDLMSSLVERSLVTQSGESGRFRLLETVRLYALDRLVSTNQLAATRNRHLAWTVGLAGLAEPGQDQPDNALSSAEEAKFAELDNVAAAMEWAGHTGQDDQLYSLFIGCQQFWPWTGSVAVSWAQRLVEPPTEDIALRACWLSTCAHIRFQAGDEATALGLAFEAAELVADLDLPEPLPVYAMTGMLYRGMARAFSGDREGALADADQLERLLQDEPRHAAWAALTVRASVLYAEGDPRALAVAQELLAEARLISRFQGDNSIGWVATLLAREGRFEEAAILALEALNSETTGQTARLTQLATAAHSLSALGRFAEALDAIETDFGPMVAAQHARAVASRATALASVVFGLDNNELGRHLTSIGVELFGTQMGGEQAVELLGEYIGSDEEFTALKTPAPEDLTPSAVSTLIEQTIAEIRETIADHRPTSRP